MFKCIRLKIILALLLIMSPFSSANAEAYCATVKIEIQQELSLERQAFDAVMKINNGLDTLSIENVSISVNFADENGLPVLATNNPNETNPDAKFYIRVDSMAGINNVDGTGIVAPATSAEIRWLIIPIPGSADGLPGGKLYFVGAHLSYTLGGLAEEVDVEPDFITVKPLPQLALDYFLTQEVIGDDAFTSAIEAPEPYTLGVRIKNNGTGIAKDIKIDSAQPKIVENEQGLLIDFKITGSSLNDLPSTPSLLIDFGTIDPGEATVGRWIMETSLSGKFIEFSAKVSHADELGGAVTSIIDSNDINTHFLLHDVRVDLPGRDSVRDFLGVPAGSTAGALNVYESDTVDTAVNNESSSATFPLINSNGTQVIHNLTMPATNGFVYASLPDPYHGQKVVTSAVRSDGKVILLDNVWTSKTRNRDTSPPSWEYWVNIFDVNSTGNYIVTMDDLVIGPLPPVIQVITDKVTFEGNQIGFIVESTDPNGDSVSLSAQPLPVGATFVDNGDGTAFFNWTPIPGQAGTYLITYKSTDGVLTAKRTATIRVNPANDTDGDGLDDAWELEQFGNLDRDGSGDFDGDGISDLDEFLNGTDPNLAPPPAPNDLSGTSGNLQVYLNWSDVVGATDYRVYWSETPNVTKELGHLIDGVLSPFAHTGLINNKSYYYALTSVGPGGESGLSAEISVTPGNKNWGMPGAVVNSVNDVLEYQVANADNGTAIAVWTENDTAHTNAWASVYAIETGWAAAQLIELSDTADVSSIRVKMDELGNAIAIWKQTEGATESLWGNTYIAGTWNTPLQITSADTGELGQAEIIITNSGAAMAAWLQADTGLTQMSNVWASLLFSNASAWNTAEPIDSASGGEVSGLQLANDGLGNVLAVWSQTLDTGSSYNFVFNRFTNSQWGTDQLIRSGMVGDVMVPVVKPELAVNQQGDAVLVWTEVNAVNSVMAMHFTIAGGWGAASLVEFDDVNAAYDPSVAISDSGDAITVWTQSNSTQDAIYSNRYQPDFGWETNSYMVSSSAIGDPVGVASLAKVEMDTTGNVIVVWQQTDSLQSNIWSNRYDLITGWEGSMVIDSLNNIDAINPLLTMDGTGNAVVVWIYTDGVSRNLLFNDLTALNTGMPNILPIVILPDGFTVNDNDAVVIDGSDSFDQDGFIALYEWSQVSGTPVALDLSNGIYTHTLSFTAPALPVAETLVFRLTATDGDNAVGTKDIAILVNEGLNLPPTVSAGLDQSVAEQTAVTLTGVATDSDGTIATYVWTQTAGITVTLTGANTATASFTSPTVLMQDGQQTLSFQLTVTDNKGATATDTINVTVHPVNGLPIVDAGLDQSVNEQSVVTLSGTTSDSDGSITSYSWTQTAGVPMTLTGAVTANASFTAPIVLAQDGAQVLSFSLTVTDNEGATVTDTINVTVNPVNANPTANAGLDQSVNEQTAVTLSGTATDTDGSIASYAWSQTAGAPVTLTGATTATASFTSPIVLAQDGAQVLSFSLTVTDNEGATVTDTINVTVNPVNANPTANAGLDQSVDEQTPVTLTGTATDTDGSIASYAWTQTSGVLVNLTGAATAAASFTSPVVLVQDGAQVLSFTLTATDNEGAVITDTVNITVNPVNATPTVNAGLVQSVNEQTTVTLTGTATDTDGSIASYAWAQTGGVAVTLIGANTSSASFTSPIVLVQDGAQVLSFTLTATDNEGSVVTDTMTVTVNPVNATPTANAGLDQTVDEQTPVTLTGTATDTDGSIAAYAWTQTSGVAVTLTGANTATASFTSPVVLVQDGAQVLSFTLTTTDNEGSVVTDTMTVTVNPVNAAPTANAGIDQSVNEQTLVTLTGTATDTDGSIATYAWTQTGGVAVTLTGANTSSASFTTPVVLVQDGAQVLSFTLTATDNEGSVVTDTMTVTVNPVNAAPTANAGLDQSVNEQTPVTLTGTATDTDGSIAAYAWTQTGGTPVTLTGAATAIASFTAPVVLVQDGAQLLSFTLTVTDNEGAVVTDAMTVTVNPVNANPTANAGLDQSVNEQTAVTLTGTAADTDGSIASYAWTQTAGVPVILTGAATATASFTAPVVLVQDGAQILSFNLTVTDNEGSVVTDAINVTVNPVNANPTANAGLDQSVNEQTAVTLTGTAADTDGSIASYAWTQTGGTPVTLTGAATAIASFTSPVVLAQDGAQVLGFSLTVTDNEGAVVTDTITVTVNPVNAIPTVDAGTDKTIAEGALTNLVATASDSDGTIASYSWTQLSGPAVILTAANTANASFITPLVYQDTSLVFKVVVTDNEAAQATDIITVVVYSTNPDDDADGMDDLWEVSQFGDMSRDGIGDFDNDGFSDYQEYQDGTNPLVLTLPAPTGLKAVADDSQVTLSWLPVDNAVNYNLYWSTTPGITTNSGTLIPNVGSGYVHTGLTNGTTYYYVVTVLSAEDESVVSEEVSATPGIRAWSAAQRIDAATNYIDKPQIAVNAKGQAVSIWPQFDGVAFSAWVNYRDPETGWGTAQAIETGDSGHIHNPEVAINDNGNAVAVWQQFNGVNYNIWVNYYDPETGWGIAEQIETNHLDSGVYFYPQVVMDNNGNATVVWQKLSTGGFISIWANHYIAGIGWQTAQLIEADSTHHATNPQIAVDAAGNVMAVWEQFDGAYYSILSNRYDAGSGAWSTETVIDNINVGSAYDPQIAMDQQGNAVAVWEQFDGTRYNVWSNSYNAATGWGTANYIEFNPNGGSVYFYPQVAMDNNGNATAVWQQLDGVAISIWSNRLVNGQWGTATVIEPFDYVNSFNPQVAMDADGNAVVVWEQPDENVNNPNLSIWSTRYSIYDGGWLQARPIETNDIDMNNHPRVAMDDYGNAITVWWTRNQVHSAIDSLTALPPVANAGPDQSGYARDVITLDGSGSYDQTGQLLTYHWHQLSGIETDLDGKTTATPTLLTPNVKTVSNLAYILTVTNADGVSMTDTVVVTALP